LASPLAATVIHATARGYLDLAECDYTERWWKRAHWMLSYTRREMDKEVYQAEALYLAARAVHEGKSVWDKLRRKVQQCVHAVQPWRRGQRKLSDREQNLDLAARWYILNHPEMLKQKGVDFGNLVVRRPV